MSYKIRYKSVYIPGICDTLPFSIHEADSDCGAGPTSSFVHLHDNLGLRYAYNEKAMECCRGWRCGRIEAAKPQMAKARGLRRRQDHANVT